MPRPVLVLLDPLDARRAQLAVNLSHRYEVRGARAQAEAEELIRKHQPAVVALSLTQELSNGLEVGCALSGLEDVVGAAIVVYGPPPIVRTLTTEVRLRLERRFHIDLFVARPFDVDELVHAICEADRRPRRHTPPTPEQATAYAAEGARRAARLSELLTADVSFESIKALLTAELGPEVVDVSGQPTQDLEWKDLLRARATAENFQKMLRKEIHPPRPRKHNPTKRKDDS